MIMERKIIQLIYSRFNGRCIYTWTLYMRFAQSYMWQDAMYNIN